MTCAIYVDKKLQGVECGRVDEAYYVAAPTGLGYLDTRGRAMSVQIPLDTMTVEEKLRAMEDIWTGLRKQPGDIPFPDWHREVLDAREQKRKDGSSVYDDWSVAKERIRKKPDEDRRQDPDRIQKRI